MASLSLVAYEDSGSDEESASDNDAPTSTLKRDSTVRQLDRPDNSTVGFNEDRQCRPTASAEGLSWQLNRPLLLQQPQLVENYKPALPIPSSITPQLVDNYKIASPIPSSIAPQSPAYLNPSKRCLTAPMGVRPYISKRQRLTRTEDDGVALCGTGTSSGQASTSILSSEVCERVLPYLGQVCRMELPRRTLFQLQAHQGAVNTVQWCPAAHTSHLLMSASMDRTIKIWDGAGSGRCLRTICCHSGAVRDACWTPCGRRLLSGSFDNTAILTDVETGSEIVKVGNQFKVTCLAVQPADPEVFLCGGFSPEVKAWDARSSKMVKTYKAGIQQTLDILFLSGGKEFITSSDSVSRDSADRTLMAWDYGTTAKLSNQIFHERYTCPSLALHPEGESFVAQTNGDYIGIFSAERPYRMNKKRRFKGHKVEGYAVQCEFSRCGSLLASGSSTGLVHFYDHQSSQTLHTLRAHQQACVCVSLHPVLPSVAATCDWSGEIKIWQ
ncbi:WD repeat-containing protein 25 isoform X2 [Engraulis encrasicolus]|uniref:WD repeat-containing protein 25 isoform X2 n=1 Tax=Engraulis encrasicolus TaxID=184585 RepID=UPI002FD19A2D